MLKLTNKMINFLAKLKFVAAAVLVLGVLFGVYTSFNKSDDISTTLIVDILFAIIASPYCYYLIKTGIWNLDNKVYTINILLLIGLVVHFIIAILLLIYSQHLFPSEEVSKQLLFTTIPFCLVGFAIGIYDAKQFFVGWKAKRLKIT